MTYGIIQKVYYDISSLIDPNAKLNKRDCDRFLELYRDKVIAEIKKLDKPRWHAIHIDLLIGDNKE